MRRRLPALLVAALALAATAIEMRPMVETEPSPFDVDDTAIWVHPDEPSRSLIVGTVKRPRPDGALAVYTLNGKRVETVPGLDRPNNVDILEDLLVATERLQGRLLVFRVHATKPHLRPLGTVPVFGGERGDAAAPMGVALYRRPGDRALFAVVSRKTGPRQGYLWQYRLHVEGGSVRGEKVRALGLFSGDGEIEAVAVDGQRGLIYYSDENCCVRIARADPDAPDATADLGRIAEQGFGGNREGIAIAGGSILVTDQLTPRSEYHVYDAASHRQTALWRGSADSTDGIDAVPAPLGPAFPHGLLVVMNNARRNFQLYRLP